MMKKKLIYLFIGIIFPTLIYSQTPKNSVVSVVSEKKDTLYLVSNPIGYEIEEVWAIYPHERPIIIFKSPEWILNEARKRKENGTKSDN